METTKKITTLTSIILGILILLVLSLGSFTIVEPGEKAIVIRFGTIQRVLEPGMSLKAPLIDRVVVLDVQVQKLETEASAASKDLQNTTARIAVNYQLEQGNEQLLYSMIGLSYQTTILNPAVQESVKAATAKYTAEELITKREAVREDIRKNLVERLKNRYIMVTDVNIINFAFSESFNEAIEAKVTAEQQALASKNKLEQTKYEAEQRVVQAKAEAEAIRIQSEALKENKGLVELEAVKKWNGVLPTYMMGNSVPFVNIK
jgi:regulator of protease activity HflC (stomatin/prohibitin superfamily)